jgi:hypothetical protein
MKSAIGRVYIGDIGTIIPPKPKPALPPIDLSQMSYRDMCNLAVAIGLDVRDIIGIEHCYEHEGMVFIADRALPEGFDLFSDCVYCKNCWRFFRTRTKIFTKDVLQ